MTGKKFPLDLMSAARSAFVAAVLAVASLGAHGAAGTLSKQDQQCLGCHSTEGFEKKLANGETLSLHVQGPAFAKSVHSMLGCVVCHAGMKAENHPPSKQAKIASVREYTLELNTVCSSCHGEIAKKYEGSIHATVARQGNAGAPVCTDCHNPHTAIAKSAYDKETGAPCGTCHFPVYKAYRDSVHGQAKMACSNCHRSHEVSAATTGDQLKSACLECHQGSLETHKTWLPNAARHFDSVSCPACHSPAAKRKVDLKLYDSVAKERVVEQAGVPQFESRARKADAKGVGLDAMALHSLLRGFNREGSDNQTTLRGRLEVSTGAEAHQLPRSAQAIRDCAKCHQQGAAPFQSVTVSIVGPDGRPLRYGANPEVLSSIISIDSISGFYAIGGTRIKLLDWLLALALLGGISVPLGHMTIRWLFRRYAKKISGKEDS